MRYQRPKLVNDEYYHVVVRAVGDTVVFEDESDFYRGIFSIYEFNNDNSVNIFNRRRNRIVEKKKEVSCEVGLNTKLIADKREKFVEVLAFSFMPNHLHMILKQTKENGISKFMQKVGTGYANYFNKKYGRMGHLFNKFRAVHISNDNQLRNAFVYVHTNIISLIEPGWKENGIKNPEKVEEFLENSKCHSYPDYLGKNKFPSVTERDFLLETMGGMEGCKEYVGGWIMHKKELKDYNNIVLE
jgi:putative transposase